MPKTKPKPSRPLDGNEELERRRIQTIDLLFGPRATEGCDCPTCEQIRESRAKARAYWAKSKALDEEWEAKQHEQG